MSESAQVRELQKLLRRKGLGKALPKPPAPAHPPLATGREELDRRLGGGLPRGAVSEVFGAESSGRTGFVFELLARATEAGEAAVYIDAADSLDPASAERAGVVLERLLWVRCDPREPPRYRHVRRQKPVDAAWQAANLVASAGGFGVVALDLAGLPARKLGEWRRRRWTRLHQAIEHGPTAVVVLAPEHLAGSVARVTLELERERLDWLEGLEAGVRLRRATSLALAS